MSEISIKKAALINAISKYSSILLNLVFSAILARILSPEDYGIVAVTVVFTTFFSLFADMGIGSGVIQNKQLTEVDVNNIFSFSVRISFLLAFVFILFSIPLSFFYQEKKYIPIGILLSVSLFFGALNMVPNALLLKNKKFLLIGIRTIIVSCFSGIIGIIFAIIGLKYYALVFQNICNSFIIFIWNYFSTKPKFVWRNCKESINKIRNYSSFLFGFNIINYFARNTDNLLISKFMGTSALGYYDKAYKLMLYPVNNLTHVITPVLHPILSEHQKNKLYIYDKYLEIVKLLSLIGAFITPFCFITSEEIIRIIFGYRWIRAIPCFRYMALSIWAQMVLSSTGAIFQSSGDTKRLFITGTMNAVMTVVFIVEGLLERNIEAVARNISISYNAQFILTFFILIHITLGLKFRNFLLALLPNFIILVFGFTACFAINYLMNFCNIKNIYLLFSIKFCVISFVYIFAIFICKQQKFLFKLFNK